MHPLQTAAFVTAQAAATIVALYYLYFGYRKVRLSEQAREEYSKAIRQRREASRLALEAIDARKELLREFSEITQRASMLATQEGVLQFRMVLVALILESTKGMKAAEARYESTFDEYQAVVDEGTSPLDLVEYEMYINSLDPWRLVMGEFRA
jgi:hypothetical protein